MSASVVDDLVIVSGPPSSVELTPVSLDPLSVSEDFHSTVDAKLAVLKSEMTDQFCSFFDEFHKQLDVKFSSINQFIRQVRLTSSSNIEQVVFPSQDVNNPSISALPPIAVQSKHTPDVGPALLQKGDVSVPSGRAAVANSLLSGNSLPHMQFRDVEGTVRYFQLLGHCIPDNLVVTLPSVVVVSKEHTFMVSGNVLADLLVSALHHTIVVRVP